MFCLHNYGIVQEDGYQYCLKCGRAKLAPLKECSHVFEILLNESQTRTIPGNWGSNQIYIYNRTINRCKKCGKIIVENF